MLSPAILNDIAEIRRGRICSQKSWTQNRKMENHQWPIWKSIWRLLISFLLASVNDSSHKLNNELMIFYNRRYNKHNPHVFILGTDTKSFMADETPRRATFQSTLWQPRASFLQERERFARSWRHCQRKSTPAPCGSGMARDSQCAQSVTVRSVWSLIGSAAS